MIRPAIVERHIIAFWARVEKHGADDCWPWTATRNSAGYGMLALGPGSIVASRLSWIIHNGPIPDGLHICHRCDNPPCVNPAHLFAGTRGDNLRDSHRKGRRAHVHTHGNPTHCHRGHEFSPENTIVRERRGRECKTCRRDYMRRYMRQYRTPLTGRDRAAGRDD